MVVVGECVWGVGGRKMACVCFARCRFTSLLLPSLPPNPDRRRRLDWVYLPHRRPPVVRRGGGRVFSHHPCRADRPPPLCRPLWRVRPGRAGHPGGRGGRLAGGTEGKPPGRGSDGDGRNTPLPAGCCVRRRGGRRRRGRRRGFTRRFRGRPTQRLRHSDHAARRRRVLWRPGRTRRRAAPARVPSLRWPRRRRGRRRRRVRGCGGGGGQPAGAGAAAAQRGGRRRRRVVARGSRWPLPRRLGAHPVRPARRPPPTRAPRPRPCACTWGGGRTAAWPRGAGEQPRSCYSPPRRPRPPPRRRPL